MLRGATDPQAAQEMSRGAAQAASQRLTLPGPTNIMRNQQDIANWQRLQALKEKAEFARRGAVPGMLSPVAGDIADEFNERFGNSYGPR